MGVTDEGRAALAEKMHERLRQLGWQQTDLHDRTRELDPAGDGVSIRTINSLATGEERIRQFPRARTSALLESALGWPFGSIEAILSGEEPPGLPVDSFDDANRLKALSDEVADLRRKLARLARLVVEDFEKPVDRGPE